MQCYKGFDKDLKCRGFQYEVGKTYETDNADICRTGFRACENPLDVFGYYPPADSRFCMVDLDENSQTENDSKRVGKRIHIETEIGLQGIISAGVKFILDKVDFSNVNSNSANTGDRSAATNTGDYSAATNTGDCSAATNTGDRSAATNMGDYSAATNTGDCSAATNTGYRSAATNTGDRSAATNTGYYSAATNTGYYSAATNTGDRSAATNTGDYSAATNTGDRSAATNTGYRSAAVVNGTDSIAIVTGRDSKAKGSVGCWLVLTERDDELHIKEVRAVCVDGKDILPDTFYMLVDGKVVPAD